MTAVRTTLGGKVRLRNGRLAIAAAGTAQALTPASSLTLAEPLADRHVFQSIGMSKAVPLSFTYTGTPSQIQARTIAAGGGDATAWQTVAINPTGGTVNASLLVTRGHHRKLQLTDGTTVWTASKTFAVGERIANIGQSNMANRISEVDKYPLGGPDSLCYRVVQAGQRGVYKQLGNQKPGFPPGTPFSVYGGGYTAEADTILGDGVVNLANRVAAGLNCAVLILPYAVIGSSIEQWQTGGNCWEAFKTAVLEIDGDFGTAIWLQGEQNAASPMPAYKQNLTNLLHNLWALTGRSAASFRFGVICLGPGANYFGPDENGVSGVNGTNAGHVRQADLEFVTEHAAEGVYLSSSAHDADLMGDDIHFKAPSHARAGLRDAQGILVPGSVIGPKIISASAAGLYVDVKVQHNSGTMLKDGNGGTGAALLGFRFFDATNAPIAYTASQITGPDTIRFTMAAAGTVRMDHAMTNAPYGLNRDLASVVYDNDTVPGDTLGLPLQPCPQIPLT